MALQTSGAISLLDIQNEFGGSNPISMSEYYGAASGIPASGAISVSQFYGKSSSLANFSTTTASDLTTTISGKYNFTYVAHSNRYLPTKQGIDIDLTEKWSLFDTNDYKDWPPQFVITQALFNAIPKTSIGTVSDANASTSYYGVEPSDLGYSGITISPAQPHDPSSRTFVKATANDLPTTPAISTTGLSVIAKTSFATNTTTYWINFLGDRMLGYINQTYVTGHRTDQFGFFDTYGTHTYRNKTLTWIGA